MLMKLLAPAALIALAGTFAVSPASAQMQGQGMTVGSPPPGGGGKPTRQECLTQAKAKGLKGAKLTAFIKSCMNPF